MGINNEGKLVFDYYHQDYGENSTIGTQDVFNGKSSVLWTNFHQAFKDEIETMYQSWRVSGSEKLSYDKMVKYFITDQTDRWSISMYNEDMEFKYIAALRNNNNPEYLYQVRGTGEEHFKYFAKNRLMFCDSKFFAGNFVSNNNRIVLRINTPDIQGEFAPNSAISYKTFSNMYAAVRYGTNTKPYVKYTPRDTMVTLGEGITGFKDTDTYIFGADQISYLDDLSLLYCSTLNISAASKLLELNVGRDAEGYENPNLKGISFTNNRLLRKVNVCNCNGFTQKVLDFTLCPDIQEILATGSNITGIDLPDSGYLKIAKLPATIETLKIVNQKYIETFKCESYKNLKSIRIENSTNMPVKDILNAITDGNYPNVRIVNMDWNVGTEEELSSIINKAINCKALDSAGLAIDSTAVITGKVFVDDNISDELRALIHQYFPDLVVVDKTGNTYYFIDYLTIDGQIYYTELISDNEMPDGPEVNPTDIVMVDHRYIFKEWDMSSFKINQNNRVPGVWLEQFAVKYYNGNVLLEPIQWATVGDRVIDPVVSGEMVAPTRQGTDDLKYSFIGWGSSPESGVIDMPIVVNVINLYAQYQNVHPVRFYATEDTSTLPHYTQWVKEGEDAHDPKDDEGYTNPPEILDSDVVFEGTDVVGKKYRFSAWKTLPVNVTGICEVHANYDTYWAVRFMNEPKHEQGYTDEVNLQWIEHGDSAVDPVDYNNTGDLDKIKIPTKTSTAQYDFNFSEWDGDYTNVTEPRVIKAMYDNILRKYNVEFYNIGNDEPIWTHEDVEYGSDAIDPVATGIIPTPEKLGVEDPTKYDFTGWAPSYKNIQGKTKCYAIFRYNDYIKDDWATIAANVESVESQEELAALYPIGARKIIPVVLDEVDYIVDVEVIAYNHDVLADDSGKAALTFFCKDLPDFGRRMYEGQSNSDGWPGSDMRTFVNGELFDGMPEELRNVIKPVYKISDGGVNSKELKTTVDKCWIPSCDEIGAAPNFIDYLQGQGLLYSDTFGYGEEGNQSRIKYLSDGFTTGKWWLRTSSYNSTGALFVRVRGDNGRVQSDNLNYAYPVAFGFCVGQGLTYSDINASKTAVLGTGALGSLMLGRSE